MAFLTRQSGVVRQIVGVECLARARNPTHRLLRSFHASSRRDIIKPFLLADIGEGTRECQIIQWFVRPGARVQQFDKICEVQSDKAATDITSPFDGVVKKLYYEADDTAIVGKPLLDIDIQSEISPENESLIDTSAGENGTKSPTSTKEGQQSNEGNEEREEILGPLGRISQQREDRNEHQQKGSNSHRTLATPAVRHLTKEFKVDIANIKGTGKDGRVLKEDVHRHVAQREEPSAPSPVTKAADDRRLPLTPIQNQMFKTMTRSLTIPHFLYTSTVDATNLTALRTKLNRSRAAEDRLTPLPFILKAISLAFTHHPLLNASLDTTDTKKPELTYRSAHNFGIAVDTPSGLLVPVIRNIEAQSVASIASQIRTISAKAREGKLQPADFQSGTFTVSNIGSIGGGVVAPIIVEPQVAIVGVGRGKVVPAFDENGALVKKEEVVLSWSADHRVVDGAECARAAERARGYLERIEELVLELR